MVIFKPHYLRMPYNFIDFTLSSYFVYVDNRSICYVLWSLFSCWTTISYIRMDCKFKISRYCWRTLRCFTWHWTVNGASLFFSEVHCFFIFVMQYPGLKILKFSNYHAIAKCIFTSTLCWYYIFIVFFRKFYLNFIRKQPFM